MSKIPTNADILIYNDFGMGAGRRFIKHEIKDVYYDETKGQNVIRMGVTDASGVEMYVGLRPDYISPAAWKLLTLEQAMSFKYFTLRKGDVIMLWQENAPNEFTSTVQIQNFFGIDTAHIISSVDTKIEPTTRQIHHFEVSAN